MTFFGVPTDTAVAAAIVLHAVSFVPVTLLGLAFMAKEGLSFSRMRDLAAVGKTEDERRKTEDGRQKAEKGAEGVLS